MSSEAKYFALAALATAWPDGETAELFGALRAELVGHPGLGPLVRRLDDGLEALQGDFLGLFDAGPDRVPLYETEYGRMRGMSKGRDLADVAGFYLAFGLAPDESELPDHVAMELEFVALLHHKRALLAHDPEGLSIVEDALRKFLEAHLGSFAPTLADVPAVRAHRVYGPLFGWVSELVNAEVARVGVAVVPLDVHASEDDVVACGACVAANA